MHEQFDIVGYLEISLLFYGVMFVTSAFNIWLYKKLSKNSL